MKLVLTFVAGALLALATAPVAAQTNARACTAMTDDTERLACYDAVFATGEAGADALTATFESEQLIPARPSGRDRARMIVACEAGNLTVSFTFAGQLISATSDFAGLTTQLDAQTARTRSLIASPDNTAIGFWSTRDAQAFLDSLAGSSNLAVRMTPANYRSLSVRFSLADLAETVGPIRAACQ